MYKFENQFKLGILANKTFTIKNVSLKKNCCSNITPALHAYMQAFLRCFKLELLYFYESVLLCRAVGRSENPVWGQEVMWWA
jgi:hypothetical protein